MRTGEVRLCISFSARLTLWEGISTAHFHAPQASHTYHPSDVAMSSLRWVRLRLVIGEFVGNLAIKVINVLVLRLRLGK
jgi:hypothetical protein